ncbi:hypothetical protein [Halorarius halobius]|uniref:hypothetical protein n=1 Tax=Halorarius halobius TaxID=2962671 RepID=UPI0020CE0151|nr:hypothetical protein [Halorarius halobius]
MATHPPSSGGRDFVTIFKTGSVDRDDYPELTEHLLEGRTQLASETGYLMKFGDVSHRGLTPFDVASLHDVPAYPLPHPALESLPAHVRADLEQDGAVQMFASYDRESHQFEDVVLAWEEQEFLERIAELIAGDLSLHEAVDWTVVEEAGRYTVAQWADIRGVTEDAVRSNINSAREKLLAEEDREPTGEPA